MIRIDQNRLRPVFEHRQSAPGKARSKPWGRGLSKEDHGLREAIALCAVALALHAKADSPWSLRPCWPCAPKRHRAALGVAWVEGCEAPSRGVFGEACGGGSEGPKINCKFSIASVFNCFLQPKKQMMVSFHGPAGEARKNPYGGAGHPTHTATPPPAPKTRGPGLAPGPASPARRCATRTSDNLKR